MSSLLKKKCSLILAGIIAVFFMGSQVYAQNVLNIGSIINTTGPAAHLGQIGLRGAQLAVDDLNSKGGVSVGGKTYKVELLNYEDKCSAKDAVTITERLINSDKVPVIIGPVCSHATLAAMELTEQNKIPMLVMFSASMKITSMGYKYVFRTCPQSAMQTEATAKYAMEDLKLKKAAFIGRNDAWAKSSLEQFTKRVKARGGEVVAAEFFDLGSTDFYSQLTKIKMANPEFLYMVSLTEDGSMLIRQARELGLKCVLTGTDELANEKAFQLAGKAMDNVYCYLISGPTQPYQKKYEELYASKYPEKSTTLDKGGWDQVMLIADALKRAGSLDPTAIRDALAKTKNFQGMKLDVTFSDIGQVQAKMYMAYLKDNKWHFIKDMKIFDNPPLPVDRE